MVKKKSQDAKKQRSKLTAEFKAKVALAALREDRTMAELKLTAFSGYERSAHAASFC